MKIDVCFQLDNLDELYRVLAAVQAPASEPFPFQSYNPVEEGEPKRKRGRPRKDDADTRVTPVDGDPPPPPADTLADAVNALPDQPPAKAKAALLDEESEPDLLDQLLAQPAPGEHLSDPEKLDRGRTAIRAMLVDHPGRAEEARRLLQRFGVNALADIPVERATEFLAEAIMLVSAKEA